jgi:hypothetical protein
MIENFPIKYVALSDDGQQLAAAGKNGFILYNRLLRSWRMFGDQNQVSHISITS